MDQVEAMRAFRAVAEEGSFTAAGRRLGRSVQRVSKLVAALEAEYGAQLLNRTTRSVTLTALGEAFLARARPLIDGFEELDDLIGDRQARIAGPIRMTAPTGFAAARLAPALGAFLKTWPEVRLDLRLIDRRVALVEEGFDLAVRIGAARDSSLIARRVAPMPLITCAAPDYLRARGAPKHPKALATHACLLESNIAETGVWSFEDAAGARITVAVNGPAVVNSASAAAALAVAGAGIARCPAYAVEDAVARGALIPVLTDYRGDDFGLFLLYPPTRNLTTRVRALIDHLVASLTPDA